MAWLVPFPAFMRTANLAIVFTDIEGFTERTSRQSYEENARMLRIHDALLEPLFKAFGGKKIKTIGDAFLVVFESPTSAVLCGMAIQDRLWSYNQRASREDQIRIRVAVAQGEVRLEKGDVFGEAVNVAARLEGLAKPGEVLFTEAVYLVMNRAEVPAAPHGEHTFKGIPEPVKVYRAAGGTYRLESGGEVDGDGGPEPTPGASAGSELEPPFGGHALGRVEGLPPPDPETLATTAPLASKLSRSLPSIPSARGRRWVGLALAVLIAGTTGTVVLLANQDPIEAAIEDGELPQARQAITALPSGPRKSYLTGRLREAEQRFGPAARAYETAARSGSDEAFDHLIDLTEHPVCEASQGAARALGRLGRPEARAALEDLAEGAPAPDSSAGSVIGEIGARLGLGCNPPAAARWALTQLKP